MKNIKDIINLLKDFKTTKMHFKSRRSVLSFGAEQKGNFSILIGDTIFSGSQYGSLRAPKAREEYESEIRDICREIESCGLKFPDLLACDMHPEYISTKLALKLSKEWNGRDAIKIQHHHAHVASCMVENGLANPVLGVAFDGTGLGLDNAIWGGEFLVADFRDFNRAGHLAYVAMPGADKAATEPYRMALSYLFRTYGAGFDYKLSDLTRRVGKDKCDIFKRMISKRFNSPLTSSAGRLFDAVSSLIGLRDKIHFEGEAAIEFERIADASYNKHYEFSIKPGPDGFIVELWPAIKAIVRDSNFREKKSLISAKFHNTLAKAIKDSCVAMRRRYKINDVTLTGGVFQNALLLKTSKRRLEDEKFCVYTHSGGMSSDMSLSVGQAVIAAFKKRSKLCV